MVYTAGSQSLAMLEMLVQDQPLRARYVVISATIPKSVKVERLLRSDLPTNWRDPSARASLQTIGGEWVSRGSSAVLAVPSSVIETETNYLINPRHPAFGKIELGQAEPFVTDPRLLQGGSTRS